MRNSQLVTPTRVCICIALRVTYRLAGTIATVAASIAGLFSFKLSKELSQRGVNRGTFSRALGNTQGRTWCTATPCTFHEVHCGVHAHCVWHRFLASADSATLLAELLRQAKQLPPPDADAAGSADVAAALTRRRLLGTDTWTTLMKGIGREAEVRRTGGHTRCTPTPCASH